MEVIAQLLKLAFDVAGLVPGASEAETVIKLGEDGFAAYEGIQAFMQTPEGKDLANKFDTLFVGKHLPSSQGAEGMVVIQAVPASQTIYPGKGGSSMYTGAATTT